MMKIYGDANSGNCLKVKYTADHLALAYEWIEIDVVRAESRTPEFLAMNAQGQVPVVVLDDGTCLAQSNAIIRYLARDSDLLPADAFAQAKVDEWLFWEQNSHEFFVAGSIFQTFYLKKSRAEIEPWRLKRADAALDVMETVLARRSFFAGDGLTVADIALLAYTRRAPLAGFDLSVRGAVLAWIDRCEQALGLASLRQNDMAGN